MNVTLKPELEKLIEDEVKSGRSTDPDEFLNKAVYHYVADWPKSSGAKPWTATNSLSNSGLMGKTFGADAHEQIPPQCRGSRGHH